MEVLHKEVSDKIIRCYYNVYNKLGFGFLEKVYENALCIELRRAGLEIEQQREILVYYDGIVVGTYKTDIIVENCVILELKAAESISKEHEAQLLNYLRGTEIEVGYILNFNLKPQFARRICTNDMK